MFYVHAASSTLAIQQNKTHELGLSSSMFVILWRQFRWSLTRHVSNCKCFQAHGEHGLHFCPGLAAREELEHPTKIRSVGHYPTLAACTEGDEVLVAQRCPSSTTLSTRFLSPFAFQVGANVSSPLSLRVCSALKS